MQETIEPPSESGHAQRRRHTMDKTRSLANLIESARALQERRVLLTALELDVFMAIGEGA
jgi:hypothetical protein